MVAVFWLPVHCNPLLDALLRKDKSTTVLLSFRLRTDYQSHLLGGWSWTLLTMVQWGEGEPMNYRWMTIMFVVFITVSMANELFAEGKTAGYNPQK